MSKIVELLTAKITKHQDDINDFFAEKFNNKFLNFYNSKNTRLNKKWELVLVFNMLNINYKNIDRDLVFLHYRIDDIGRDRRVLPLEYYIEALETTRFNSGYITSDSINHPNCTYLINKYDLKPVHGLSPMNTIFLGKNFNKLILSEGTFSWWIGFLSRAESIICNKRDFLWHGDIFLDRWKKLNWDYNENTPINLKNNL